MLITDLMLVVMAERGNYHGIIIVVIYYRMIRSFLAI